MVETFARAWHNGNIESGGRRKPDKGRRLMSQAASEAVKNVVEVPREISGAATQEDQLVESSLRPRSLEEYVGQPKITTNLKIFLRAARARREPLDHVLFFAPPGLLKTTLSQIIASA